MITQEQKRIKIAEAVGIKKHARFYALDHGGMRYWTYSNRSDAERSFNSFGDKTHPIEDVWIPGLLPDYFNDLNAIWNAEKILTIEQLWEMDAILFNLENCKVPFRATAEERAEAFGKTLNLW